MPDENEQGTTTPSEQTPPANGSTRPEDTVEYWKAQAQSWQSKYNGLQGHATTTKRKLDELTLAQANGAQEYEAQLTALTTERDTYKADLEAHRQSVEALTAKSAKLERHMELGRTIRGQFPSLAELFDEGLLLGVDGLEGDDLANHLTSLSQKFEKVADDRVRGITAGATPPPPGQQQQQAGMTREEVFAKMTTLLNEKGPNDPEYKAAFAQYTQMLIAGDQK